MRAGARPFAFAVAAKYFGSSDASVPPTPGSRFFQGMPAVSNDLMKIVLGLTEIAEDVRHPWAHRFCGSAGDRDILVGSGTFLRVSTAFVRAYVSSALPYFRHQFSLELSDALNLRRHAFPDEPHSSRKS